MMIVCLEWIVAVAWLSSTATAFSAKTSWRIFVDLQCPFARRQWLKLPQIKERFQDEYDISMHLTSLAFHPQSFVGQQAAYLIGREKGPESKQAFIDACFKHQMMFMNDALGDCRKSDVNKVFADIAEEYAIVFDDNTSFTRQYFLEHLHDWDEVIKPAWAEHKIALNYGAFGSPKHVIDEKLVPNTESSWGPNEWEEQLKKISTTVT